MGSQVGAAGEQRSPWVPPCRHTGPGCLQGITAATWRKTCAPSVGFLDEDHFRAYHVINLLRVLSDRDAPIFEECAVPTGGVLDYCVRIGRRWLPVEAKLQAPATQTLRAQLKRYAGQVRFRPTKGALQHTWQRAAPFRSFLIVDIEGIHLNDMERTRVLVTRGEMQSLPDVAIRRRVSAELCAQRGTGTAEVGLAR